MPMVISFPDSVSSTTQFFGAPARPDSASSAKSQAISTGIEFIAGAGPKSEKSTDENFEAVLAWMISGIALPVQPPAVAESADTTPASDSVETIAAEITNAFGAGQAMTQAGSAMSPEMTSAPSTAPSQNITSKPDVFSSGKPEPPTFAAVTADNSLTKSDPSIGYESSDGTATAMRSQSAPVSSNPASIDGLSFLPTEPHLFSPAVRTVSTVPEVQTSAFSIPVTLDSALSAAPEALSQDAIDALERIGRLPGSTVTQSAANAVPQAAGTVSASQIPASSTFTLPVSVPPVDVTAVSTASDAELPIAAVSASALSESPLLKTPVPVFIPPEPVLPASTQKLAASQPSALPVTAAPVTSVPASALPVTAAQFTASPVLPSPVLPSAVLPSAVLPLPGSAAPMLSQPVPKAPVTTASTAIASETATIENSKPFIDVTADHVLASDPKVMIQPSSFPVASKANELVVESVRGRSSSVSALAVGDISAFSPRVESPAAVAPASDVVRSDAVTPTASHALPDLTTSMSGEMRPTLSNQVSQAIIAHFERNGARSNDTLSVRLDPPELGEMTIELSKTHEGLAVRVTAREAVTMDMLFARGQEIESHLRSQQMNLKSLEFLRADMSGNQFSQRQGQQQGQGQGHDDASRGSGNPMNQARRGSRSFNSAGTNAGRIATPDSTYGLSFRA